MYINPNKTGFYKQKMNQLEVLSSIGFKSAVDVLVGIYLFTVILCVYLPSWSNVYNIPFMHYYFNPVIMAIAFGYKYHESKRPWILKLNVFLYVLSILSVSLMLAELDQYSSDFTQLYDRSTPLTLTLQRKRFTLTPELTLTSYYTSPYTLLYVLLWITLFGSLFLGIYNFVSVIWDLRERLFKKSKNDWKVYRHYIFYEYPFTLLTIYTVTCSLGVICGILMTFFGLSWEISSGVMIFQDISHPNIILTFCFVFLLVLENSPPALRGFLRGLRVMYIDSYTKHLKNGMTVNSYDTDGVNEWAEEESNIEARNPLRGVVCCPCGESPMSRGFAQVADESERLISGEGLDNGLYTYSIQKDRASGSNIIYAKDIYLSLVDSLYQFHLTRGGSETLIYLMSEFKPWRVLLNIFLMLLGLVLSSYSVLYNIILRSRQGITNLQNVIDQSQTIVDPNVYEGQSLTFSNVTGDAEIGEDIARATGVNEAFEWIMIGLGMIVLVIYCVIEWDHYIFQQYFILDSVRGYQGITRGLSGKLLKPPTNKADRFGFDRKTALSFYDVDASDNPRYLVSKDTAIYFRMVMVKLFQLSHTYAFDSEFVNDFKELENCKRRDFNQTDMDQWKKLLNEFYRHHELKNYILLEHKKRRRILFRTNRKISPQKEED